MEILNKDDINRFATEYKNHGVVTFPFLLIDKTQKMFDNLIGKLPQSEWILSCYYQGNKSYEGKDIAWCLGNMNIMTKQWSQLDSIKDDPDMESARYFFLSGYTEQIMSLDLLKTIRDIVPQIKAIKEIRIISLTNGCYASDRVEKSSSIRFFIHLSPEWLSSYGGSIFFPNKNLEIIPKSSHITIIKLESESTKYRINPVTDVPYPYLAITGLAD